ncbi:hypothetical protein [Cognataquiflexum aquatile]|uniref:hypothetical protein n=1 Tax=Cognataquiflexum aquatile TaxID=2249427 RepID=UPI000DEA501C|nr:hypothetical protein [Cognataquiflexum aquatile]
MSSVELKKILIQRIAEINDEQFLKAIRTILDTKIESELMLLSEGQKLEIQESRKEIVDGKFVDQSELEAEFGKWLKEK